MNKSIQMICLIFICLQSGFAHAGNDACDVDKNKIYGLFKSYRSDVYNDVSSAKKYFSSTFFDYYKKRIEGTESRKVIKYQYLENLKVGLSIKKVYQVDLKCINQKSLDLIMGVNFYFGDWSPAKETSFGLFKFRYIKENGNWKIESMSTSVWKKDTLKINTGHIIDNFVVTKEPKKLK